MTLKDYIEKQNIDVTLDPYSDPERAIELYTIPTMAGKFRVRVPEFVSEKEKLSIIRNAITNHIEALKQSLASSFGEYDILD